MAVAEVDVSVVVDVAVAVVDDAVDAIAYC